MFLGNVGGFVEHISNVFCLFVSFPSAVLDEKASEEGQPRGAGSNLHGCHPPRWTAAAQEEDY